MSENDQAPTESSVRLCLSSSLSCAGLSPCEACRTALAQYVIPGGLIAAGVADAEAVALFVDGYNAARRLLLQEISRAVEARKRQPTAPFDKPTEPSVERTQGAIPLSAPSAPVPASPPVRAPRASRKPTARTPKNPAAAPAEASPLPANGAAGEAHPAPSTTTIEETKAP